MERLKYGLHLQSLTQEVLEKAVQMYDIIIQPPEFLVEWRNNIPLDVTVVLNEVYEFGGVERRWGSKHSIDSKFRIVKYKGGHNPLIGFTFDPNYPALPESKREAARALIDPYETAVESYLIERGLAIEVT